MKREIPRIISRPFYAALPLLNSALDRLECTFADSGDRTLRYPPVLIIGAPRSGSTILFQALTQCFDFGYLSNLHCLFYGAPSWVERVVHPLKDRLASTFTSIRGEISGLSSPSECGAFWYRFFRRSPQYVSRGEADPAAMRRLRGAVRALGDAFRRPILFKNLHCSLRLQPIAAALGEAVFIYLRRDLVENAHSLVQTRMQVYGNYDQWWSMEPPAIESLRRRPAYEQVVEQVLQLNALIESDRLAIGPDRFVEVAYEEFCDHPALVLDRVHLFLQGRGAAPARRREPPAAFHRRQNGTIDPDLFARMRDYAEAVAPGRRSAARE